MNNFSNTHLTYSDLFENKLDKHKVKVKEKCSCLKYENNNHIIGNINNHIKGNINNHSNINNFKYLNNNSLTSNIEDLKTNNTNLTKLFTRNQDIKESKRDNLIIKPPLNNSNLLHLFTKENNTPDIPNMSIINKNLCNRNPTVCNRNQTLCNRTQTVCNLKNKCNTCYCNYPQYNFINSEAPIQKPSNKDNLEYIFQISKEFANTKNYDNKTVNCNCNCDYILYDC